MKHLEYMMQREMTRKEFLAILGVSLLSVMGVGALIRLFGKNNTPQHRNAASTYGSSTYGRPKRLTQV